MTLMFRRRRHRPLHPLTIGLFTFAVTVATLLSGSGTALA